MAGRWDNFIDDVWHFQYNYCRFRHAVVSAMTGTKKRVGSGHKSARFAELVKQVQSINQASREGKMPAGQCAQLVLWANVKITNFCSHFPTLLENNCKFPQLLYCLKNYSIYLCEQKKWDTCVFCWFLEKTWFLASTSP